MNTKDDFKKLMKYHDPQKVYNAIAGEREFQNIMTMKSDRPDMVEDFDIGKALSAIRVNLRKAEDAWYIDSEENNYQNTMEYLRKVAAICVSQGERYGMPERVMPE